MKRVITTLLVALVLSLSAAPAFAQARDPFEPAASSGTYGSPSGASSETSPDASTSPDTADPSVQGDGTLAATGGDPTPWLAVAYALIAFGAAAVFVARLTRPQPTALRR